MSAMSFASLQEAWGVSTFGGVEPVEPPAKQPQVQKPVLEQTQSAQTDFTFVTNYIRSVYKQQGAAGVLGLMDPECSKAIRRDSVLSFDWVDADALLLGFLFVCALWLIGDAVKK